MGHFSIKYQKQIVVDSIFGIKMKKSMFTNWRIEVVCFLWLRMRSYKVQWFMWTCQSSWMQPWGGRHDDSSAHKPHMPVNWKRCHSHTQYWCSFDCYRSIWPNLFALVPNTKHISYPSIKWSNHWFFIMIYKILTSSCY